MLILQLLALVVIQHHFVSANRLRLKQFSLALVRLNAKYYPSSSLKTCASTEGFARHKSLSLLPLRAHQKSKCSRPRLASFYSAKPEAHDMLRPSANRLRLKQFSLALFET